MKYSYVVKQQYVTNILAKWMSWEWSFLGNVILGTEYRGNGIEIF